MSTNVLGRIGVLMGGPSSEREISLKSGKAVYQALRAQGLDVVPIDIRSHSIAKVKRSGISLAFIALHGSFGEDGTVQKKPIHLGKQGNRRQHAGHGEPKRNQRQHGRDTH